MKKTILLLVLFSTHFASNAQVIINELFNPCLTNTDCKKKEVNWVELYNPNEFITASFYFTNNREELQKWPVISYQGNSHFIGTHQYYVIEINDKMPYSSAKVEINDPALDTLYLVMQLENDSLKIVDTKAWTEAPAESKFYSSGFHEFDWKVNLLQPSPSRKNILAEEYQSKKRMDLFVAPFGATGIVLNQNVGQKNTPFVSYGFGVYRTKRTKSNIDLQYGISLYKIGYNAHYSTTDTAGMVTRERTSTSKSRGLRSGIEFKVGLPATKKLTLYAGFELAFINSSKLLVSSDMKITYPDGTVKNSQFETHTTSENAGNYLIAYVLEADYKWKRNICFTTKFISANELASVPGELTTMQWNFLFGAKWNFWSGRKQIESWTVF